MIDKNKTIIIFGDMKNTPDTYNRYNSRIWDSRVLRELQMYCKARNSVTSVSKGENL